MACFNSFSAAIVLPLMKSDPRPADGGQLHFLPSRLKHSLGLLTCFGILSGKKLEAPQGANARPDFWDRGSTGAKRMIGVPRSDVSVAPPIGPKPVVRRGQNRDRSEKLGGTRFRPREKLLLRESTHCPSRHALLPVRKLRHAGKGGKHRSKQKRLLQQGKTSEIESFLDRKVGRETGSAYRF